MWLEGCGGITDKDWTVCTCNGQVLRQQVVVMVLVGYGRKSIKKKPPSLPYKSKVPATTVKKVHKEKLN